MPASIFTIDNDGSYLVLGVLALKIKEHPRLTNPSLNVDLIQRRYNKDHTTKLGTLVNILVCLA